MIRRWTWLLPSVFLLWWFKSSGKMGVVFQDAQAARLDDNYLLVKDPVRRTPVCSAPPWDCDGTAPDCR